MIFVTGASGLVGSFIVRELVKKNIRPRCLKRQESDLFLLQDIVEQIDWVEGDILDVPGLEQLLIGIDTIIHAAALVSFNPEHQEALLKTNVEGTANLANIALQKKMKKFFFVSSISSLGKSKKNAAINEKAVWEDDKENSFYAKSKYLAELEVWRAAEEGLDTIIINPTIILGPGNWNNGSTRLFKYAYQENKFYPPGSINCIDVRDVAAITLKLLELNISNERFILNAHLISYKIFLEKIAAAFKRSPPIYKAGKAILSFAWRFEAFVSFVKGKDPMLTKETARAAQHILSYENGKIKKLLDYEFHSIDESICWVADELLKQKK